MLAFLTALAIAGPTEINLEGWKIMLAQGVLADKDWAETKGELTRQLQTIKRLVDEKPLKNLQKVAIWVDTDSKVTPCMAYHPSRGWLQNNGANPDMAKCVELGSCKRFVDWTYIQPYMVLHELAHAYHDQFLDKGFENPTVLDAFKKSMEMKKYVAVLHWDGRTTKHYATTNQMEYFAETTESYFGTNDFFPFIRAELRNFDPGAAALMKEIWGAPDKRR